MGASITRPKKVLCGLPFYGSNNRSWSAVRSDHAANREGYDAAIDPDSLEVLIDGEWFTGFEGTLPDAADDGHRGARRALTVAGAEDEYFCVIVPVDRTAADVGYRVLAAPGPAFATPRLMVLHETIDQGDDRIEAVWRDIAPLAARPRAFARVETRVIP